VKIIVHSKVEVFGSPRDTPDVSASCRQGSPGARVTNVEDLHLYFTDDQRQNIVEMTLLFIRVDLRVAGTDQLFDSIEYLLSPKVEYVRSCGARDVY
jgi:hypothetical protein